MKKPKPRAASEKALRKEIVAIAQRMSRSGLSPGRSGNVSARVADGMLITPTGMAYDAMQADDVVHVGADGALRRGERRPSSEWHFHLACYAARPDRHAVVHTHSMHATVLACARRPIPAFHYMVAVAGGADIPCVPYATFGTDALARNIAIGIANRDACLTANHGQVALGETLSGALELASEVECLAEQYFKVLLLDGAHILPDAEIAAMLEKFKSYGQKAEDA